MSDKKKEGPESWQELVPGKTVPLTEFSNPPGTDDAADDAEQARPSRSSVRGGLLMLVGGMLVGAGIQELAGEPPRSPEEFLRGRRLVARTHPELVAWLRRHGDSYALTRGGIPVRLHAARGPRAQGRLQEYAGKGVWRPHVPVAWSNYYQGPSSAEDLGW